MNSIEDNISVQVDKSVIRQYNMLFIRVPARLSKITRLLKDCYSDKTITGLVSWKLFKSMKKYNE